ncbi:hypothetical protein FDP22_14895 [Paroceanicella profunda]|uniref:YhdP central domain-containing protein n=1 Tax=Paroceanicella profunda TaxID=2579971 RepID=A0A5B8FI87_9RHOB|nr:AsmA-like C-terminal domain-containing protein [Paroceanicella profunda]QDL92957.1 hypothetical protein FDP22_14895 [Paroceanicella profunda]
MARHGVHSLARLVVGLMVILVVLGGLLMLRLQKGPVEIPWVNSLVEARLEAALPGNEVSIGSLVFGLGQGEDDPAGLRLRNLALRDRTGTVIFSVPEIGARFELADVVRGVFAPTEVFVAGAAGQIRRDADGRFSVLLLPMEEAGAATAPEASASAAGPAASDTATSRPAAAGSDATASPAPAAAPEDRAGARDDRPAASETTPVTVTPDAPSGAPGAAPLQAQVPDRTAPEGARTASSPDTGAAASANTASPPPPDTASTTSPETASAARAAPPATPPDTSDAAGEGLSSDAAPPPDPPLAAVPEDTPVAGAGDDPALADRRENAFQAFMSALAEDREPALRKLTRIRLIRARLRYVDALSGRVWSARNGGVTLSRSNDRISGAARIRLEKAGQAPTVLALTANYAFGADSMALTARFENAWAGDVADQIPALEWIRPLEAPLSGTYEIDLGLDGSLGYLTGLATLAPGTLRLGEDAVPLNGGLLDIIYDGRGGHFTLKQLTLDTEQASVNATGEADLARSGGTFTGITAQLSLSDIVAAPRGQLAAPVRFAGGRVTVRAQFDPFRLDIGQARLIDGDERITVSGTVARAGADWHMALDGDATGITARRLAALWPLNLARGGRKWLDENLEAGLATRVKAGFRFDGQTPQFAMNFEFQDAVAYPVRGLPAIVNGRGIGSLDLGGLSVTLQGGEVDMEGFDPIDMTGSVFAIPDFDVNPQHADARLRGTGPVPAILTLIDQPPLRLLDKIGLDPGFARGQAEVAARLTFPLIKDLDTDQLQAQAQATITDASADSPVPALPLSARRLTLTADNSSMQVSGVVQAGPAPIDLTWNEQFSPSRSTMEGRVTITPALLSALGVTGIDEAFSGTMPTKIAASLTNGEKPRFSFDGDMAQVSLSLPGLGWTKPAGVSGRLKLAGRLTDTDVRGTVSLQAADLALQGNTRMGLDGAFIGATFPTFRLGEAINSTLTIVPRENAPLRLRLKGGSIDLLALGDMVSGAGPRATATATAPAQGSADAPAAGPDSVGSPPETQGETPRIAVDFDLDSLIITPRIRIEPATGRLRQNRAGRVNLAFEGLANGGAKSELTILQTTRGLNVQLDSQDAGKFLRDTAYFGHAYGGQLRLVVHIPTGDGDMTGQLALRRVQVRDDPTLSQLLSIASITGVLETLATGGLTFDSVDAPFAWRDGRLVLGKTRATGPSLGITVEGVYDEGADSLDLSGVFSPAFILNGLLSGVPVLGDLLTGGKGEGVFGFSYSVTGSADDPSVSVNPLSILTPGALRSIFSSAHDEAPVPDPGPLQLDPAPQGSSEGPQQPAVAPPAGDDSHDR